MSQERIDVYYKSIGPGTYHKYIVYTDRDGNNFTAMGAAEETNYLAVSLVVNWKPW